MFKLSAAFALVCAAAVVAQSPVARFGLKGGAFDANGYDTKGLDAFGYDSTGNKVAATPDGKANTEVPTVTATPNTPPPPPPSPHVNRPDKTKKKHKEPKPFITPTPVFTPVFTPFITESSTIFVPVVETTVIFPLATKIKVETVTFVIPLSTAEPLPTESSQCFGGIVVFNVNGNAGSEFAVEMYLAEVAYLASAPVDTFQVVSFEYDSANDVTRITTITCDGLAYARLLEQSVANQEGFCKTTFPSNVEIVVISKVHAKNSATGPSGSTRSLIFQGPLGAVETEVIINC